MADEIAAIGTEAAAGTEAVGEVESQAEGIETQQKSGTESPEQQQETQPVRKVRASLETVSSQKRDALKAIDPSLPGLIRDAVFAQKTLQREFPGGLKEAVALRDAYESAGGEAGIRESQEALADYGRLEQWFEAGDKKFVERLAEESPESFSAMMPAGLEAWRKKDPEMYTHIMASVMMNTLGPNVIQTIRGAYDVLAADQKNAAAANALAELHDKLLGFAQVSSKKPERQVDPKATQLDQREKQLTERETQASLNPIISEGSAHIKSLIQSEMSRSYDWENTDPDVRSAMIERVEQQIAKIAKNDKPHREAQLRRRANGQWDDVSRIGKQYASKVAPSVIARAAKLFNIKPRGSKTVPKPAAGQQIAAKGAVQQGWIRVSGPPSIGQVDRVKTTQDMLYDGKAILRDGKKVVWG